MGTKWLLLELKHCGFLDPPQRLAVKAFSTTVAFDGQGSFCLRLWIKPQKGFQGHLSLWSSPLESPLSYIITMVIQLYHPYFPFNILDIHFGLVPWLFIFYKIILSPASSGT